MVPEIVNVPNNVDAADEFEKKHESQIFIAVSFVFIKTLHLQG